MENTNALSVIELNFLLEKMKKCLAVSNHSRQTISSNYAHRGTAQNFFCLMNRQV